MDKKLYKALVYAYELLKEQAETGHYPVNALTENGGKSYEPIINALKSYEYEYLENKNIDDNIDGFCECEHPVPGDNVWSCGHCKKPFKPVDY